MRKLSSLSKGLVLHLPLDQKSYNPATKRFTDRSAFGNHGTSVNAASFVADRMGQSSRAMAFGGGDKLSADGVIGDVDLSRTGDVSMSGWFHADPGNAHAMTGFYTDGSPDNYFVIGTHTDLVRMMMRGGGGTYPRAEWNESFDDEWVHLVAVKAGETARLYVGGDMKVEDCSTGLDNDISVNDFDIGFAYSFTYAFRGDIADFRVYNRALSDAEAKLLSESYRPKTVVQQPFVFDVINTQIIDGHLSNATGEPISVDWGDGSARDIYDGVDQAYYHDYGSASSHVVRMYSKKRLTKYRMGLAGVNISFDLKELPYTLDHFYCTGSNTVSGDLANLPSGVTYFTCRGSNTVSGDIANLPSGLTYFYSTGLNTVSGDLANVPSGLTYFTCQGSNTVSGDIANVPSEVTTFSCAGSNTVSGDIANLPSGLTYFGCFGSNTVSGDIGQLPSGVTYFYSSGSNTVSGDIANLPSGVTTFRCLGSNTVSGDIGMLPSGIRTFSCYGSNIVSGDIANLPSGLTYFTCHGSNTVSDYSGKTWGTKPGTFILIPASGGLSTAEVDQLLIDFDADLTWATGNVITLTGTNAARSAASDAAVANIELEGATVTTN